MTCDPIQRPLTDVAKRRPVYALMMFPDDLQQQTGLTPVPTIDEDPPPVRQALPAIRPHPVRAGPARPGTRDVDAPTTRCSTSAAPRGSSGSASGSPIGRTRALGGARRCRDLADRRPAIRSRWWLERRRRPRWSRGRSSSTACASSCGRPTRARSGSSRSTPRCCRGCGTQVAVRAGGRSAAGRPPPVRLHRARDAGDGRRGRERHPRGRVAPDRRLGAPQRRAVRAGRSADPLDRRRRRGLHGARGPTRSTLRRDRPRPTELRPRAGSPAPWRIEDDLPRLLGGLRPGPRTRRVRAADGAHAPASGPTGWPTIVPTRSAGRRAAVDAGDLGLATADGRVLELGAFARTSGRA